MNKLTFGQKIGLSFLVLVLLALVTSAVAVYSLWSTGENWKRVIEVYVQDSADAADLESLALRRIGDNRAFLLTADPEYQQTVLQMRTQFDQKVNGIRARVGSDEERSLLSQVVSASQMQAQAADKSMSVATSAKGQAAGETFQLGKQFETEVRPANNALQNALAAFTEDQDKRMRDAVTQARRTADMASTASIVSAILASLLAAGLGYFLTRGLSRQVGSAVQHIQSSSAELQAAANQQAASSKEQVASMNEISTTIRELLSTARQIAESAQRVSQIAESSAKAARDGDTTVQRAHNDVAGIRQQVDVIVQHMLDLGRKSQQIGAILEIINELAEQTNILAINATIEAAGAGESGRRFSVVADEIRKLADRVGGSTREIRTLIEEVRSAVNTTVMATETGSKAVDTGTRQFGEVAGAFRQIVDLLSSTTEAAREIELSTKQQSTAVEQVNLAVANVTQASRETEASSGQVLQTVGELTTLSHDLAKLVRPVAS